MKKRLFTSILSVLLLVILSVFGLAGCGTTEETKRAVSLDVSAKEIFVGESFTLTATATPADAEIVWSSSDEAIVTVTNGTVLGVSVGTAIVTAKNDTATATCEITVKEAEAQTYTVVFKNGETELKSTQVAAGGTVSYIGAQPSKAATEQYAYTFSGWATSADGEAVDLSSVSITENKTFYAVFTESVRKYAVTWNINGATTSEAVAYGAVPEYTGATPTKPTVGNTSYTFKGWAASLSGEVLDTFPAVTGEVTYYAIFDEVTAQTKFTVVWINGGAVLETDVNVEFEATPSYDGETPIKAATTECEYTFIGWAISAEGEKLDVLPDVTADETYYAVFEESARKYAITWVMEGKEETSQCAYGSVPTYAGTPVKEDSAECSYKFSGWATSENGEVLESLPEVEGEATYYAVFVVDKVFEAPKFEGGQILYSANSQETFLPDGLLEEGVSLQSAVVKAEGKEDVVAYADGAWIHSSIALTEEEVKVNAVGVHKVEVLLSNGDKYTVDMFVYAGVIDELKDFPRFFNNDATLAIAPNTYGYYIVIKDLGSATDELAFTQTAGTDYSPTNGFNGVLDGQGHTLRFKLMSGGLVGMVLGNAVIKNLGVIFEDATPTHYGIFGCVTCGAPEIRNCYIEQTNNHYQKTTTFGLMAKPNAKLRLHNTVVYGYNVGMDSNQGSVGLNETSSNAYVIHGRAAANTWNIAGNFTKVINDGIENGSRELALSEIADASTFDDNYWYKQDGKLIWKGLTLVTATWVNGEETVTETLTQGCSPIAKSLPKDTSSETETIVHYWSDSQDGATKIVFNKDYAIQKDTTYYMIEKYSVRYYTVTWNIDGVETTTKYEYNQTAAHDDPVKEADQNYSYEFKGWALSEDGELVELGAVTQDGIVYYAVFEKTAIVEAVTIVEPMMYSSGDNQLFLPEELSLTLDETVKITDVSGETIYYENGEWVNNFALTAEQIQANAIGTFEIKIEKGSDKYLATVKSYAGVIDEFSDLNTFFDTKKEGVAADAQVDTYGYYVLAKNLVDVDTVVTMNHTTGYSYAGKGFMGVLDGMGHTLSCTLKGYLLGNELGNCLIKDIALKIQLRTAGEAEMTGQVGVLADLCAAGRATPTIENVFFVVLGEVPTYNGQSAWYIMSRPNGNLVLKDVVIQADVTKAQAGTTYQISADSENAFVIWARAAMVTAGQATNFDEVSTNGALTGDLSVLDSNYWTTTDNKPGWKTAADITFSSVETIA